MFTYNYNSPGGNRLSLHNGLTALLPLVFLESKTNNPEKTTGAKFNFQYMKKGLHFSFTVHQNK